MVIPSHIELSETPHRACLCFNLCQTIVKIVLLNTVTMTSVVRSGETLLCECEYDGQVVLLDRLLCLLFYGSVGVTWVEVEDHRGLEKLIQHPLWTSTYSFQQSY